MARAELARFLRDRRGGLRPADAGLPAGPRRRTPGLRREEVAELASMSVDYYARLEQARGPRPSPRVLDALATALRLASAERAHLFRLAQVPQPAPPGPPRTVRPYVAGLLNRMPETAAIVTSASYDVIAWNPLAEALARLLAELRAGSEEFTSVWETNPVRPPGHRTKVMSHPRTGRLRINCDVLTVPDDDQQVVFMTADPGSPSARALRWLAATAAA